VGLEESTYIVVGARGKWDSKDGYHNKNVILSSLFTSLSTSNSEKSNENEIMI
jgi:hypothetical protein